MKDLEKVKDIIKVGRKFVIPERFEEWRRFCYDNSGSEKGMEVVKEILAIISMLGTVRTPVKELAKQFDGEQYTGEEWEWIQKQVVRFSPIGYDFVKHSTNFKSYYFAGEIDLIKDENNNFASQIKKSVRV